MEEENFICKNAKISDSEIQAPSRQKWSKDIEFLLSCISLSVGLGNVWRYPFTALENGGGAFIIPYIVVLLAVGRPVYYLEVILGQFSSRGCVKAFAFAPIMKGTAYGQVYATIMAITYYAAIMGLTLRYLLASINTVLPWSYCSIEWGSSCLHSALGGGNENLYKLTEGGVNDDDKGNNTSKRTSAEFYFVKEILKEKDSIENGIGLPNWELVACLAVAWCVIAVIVIKGVKSSGKSAYFLAIFPHSVLIILLIRAVTLPGAINGIWYFLEPKWSELLNPKVWYAAVTQVFFALAICFGTLITYASYNQFERNVRKDVFIITTIDFLCSMVAGFIIFGILGNLAYETNQTDISSVVKGGAGLAFISYPDAISKFTFLPQLFGVLFFMMLFVLGVGSNVGMMSCITTVVRDNYPMIKQWKLVLALSTIGFFAGIIYMTPGGQFILNLIDYFGASFVALVLAIAELVAVGWVYGVKNFCRDIEFMCGRKTGIYWRICWGLITPGLMLIILLYTIFCYEPLTYNNIRYPDSVYVIGWTITAIGIGQLPFWAIYTVYKQKGETWKQKLQFACRSQWHPADNRLKLLYHEKVMLDVSIAEKNQRNSKGFLQKFYDNIFG